MKRINYIISTYLILFLLVSCNALDLSPEDYYGSSNFWNNSSQVKGYMIGLHGRLREKAESLFILGEARGGTLKSGTSFLNNSLDYSSPIKTNTFSKYLTGINNWNGLYENILEVNLFIQKVENECDFLTSEERNQGLAQAYGLRAFYYFMLYRTYGGVPLVKLPNVMNGVTHAENLYLERSSAKETFDFIKGDIQKSEELFGTNGQIGKGRTLWSKPATLMLKAEIYLWSAKVSTEDQIAAPDDATIAKKALEPLIGQFRLLPDFKDVFDYENKGNDEIIFAIGFADGEKSNFAENFTYYVQHFNNQFYGQNGQLMADTLETKGNGLLRNEYKWGLFASMDDDDTRKRSTFLDCYYQDGAQAGLILRKFMGMLNSNGNRSYCDDYIIYRYADVLLMMAEIETLQGGNVAGYINQVRQRAYGASFKPAVHVYENSTFEQNELAILKERDKEFVWEGKRWFDLVRMCDGTKKSLVFSSKANYDDPSPVLNEQKSFMILWPIDIETLNNDPKLVNNPGYEN